MLNNAYDKDLDYNYLTQENNAKVALFSSETKGCSASNVLSTDRKVIWLTESSIPQHIVIDLGNLIKKPKSNFKYFGIYCWHAYSTNPKVIELQFSKDSPKGNLISFGKYEIALKPGTQFFEIKNSKLLDSRFKYMKVIIKEAHGGNRTYLNQVYLFDELSGAGTINASTMNSFKVTQNSNRKENIKVNASESLFDGEREEEKDEDLDVEDVPLREPSASAIERSYLMKNLNHDMEDENEFENTCNKNRYINFDMEEDIDESLTGIKNEASRQSNKNKDLNRTKDKEREKDKDNKRVKKIESILKSKGKENTRNKSFDSDNKEYQEDNNAGNVQKYLSSQESNKKDDTNKFASNKTRTKSENLLNNKIYHTNGSSNSNVTNQYKNNNSNKEKLNRTFTHETSGNKNKNDSLALHIHSTNNPLNEYQQLENQLKDMEEHLKSMEADIKIEDYKYNNNNIHNQAFIPRNQNNHYNTISATGNYQTLNHSKSSGYINTPHIMNNMNFNNANKDTGFNFGVSSGTNVTNPFIIKKELNQNQNDLLNNYLELDNDNLDRENNNNIFAKNKDNSIPLTAPSSSLEVKIQNIENKLGKFEGELKDMKNSFNKLMDNINRLVETGLINSGSNHNYNNGNNNAGIYNTIPQNISKNQNSNTNFDSINVAALGINTHNNNSANNSNIYNHNSNDMINLILSECNKMINEKLNINSTTINGNTNSNISSAKKRDNFKNTLHNHNPNDSFEEKLNKKIEEKFDVLANNIETQIYNNFLKPSINSIEKTMRSNFDDIKFKIKSINSDNLTETNRQSLDFEPEFKSSTNRLKETERVKKLDNKLDEINVIGGRLYEKLLLKEKKLNELKVETTSYLKKKLQGNSAANLNSSLDSYKSFHSDYLK